MNCVHDWFFFFRSLRIGFAFRIITWSATVTVQPVVTYGDWARLLCSFFCFIFSCSSMLCKSAAICIFFTLGWQWFCSSSWKMKWKKMKMKCSDVDETKLIIPQRRRRRRDTTFMERKGTLNRRAACTFYSLFSLSSFIQPKVPIDFTWMRE